MSFFSKDAALVKTQNSINNVVPAHQMEGDYRPPLWLLSFIIGLPLFSETVYTPCLVDVAKTLATSHSWVEYTLSIYLAAFALGTLLWGSISDRYGRKTPLILGLLIYGVGSLLCAVSNTIEMLLLSRFIQAFGGSTGSILGQVICRDVFTGKDRGVVFSSLGAILSVAPAIGPVCGGILAESLGWRGMFMALSVLGFLVSMVVLLCLKETRTPPSISPNPNTLNPIKQIGHLFCVMMRDPKILLFGFLIGGMNGIMFSYYGEGAFYLMEKLDLRPVFYGMTFILLSGASIVGSLLSKKLLQKGWAFSKVISLGLCVSFGSLLVFVGGAYFEVIHPSSSWMGVCLSLICMGILYFGMDLSKPSILSHALDTYQHVSGAASSLFGCYYYGMIALFTMGMAFVRNDSMTTMPLYFLGIAVVMMGLFFAFNRKKTD